MKLLLKHAKSAVITPIAKRLLSRWSLVFRISARGGFGCNLGGFCLTGGVVGVLID